MALCSSKLFLNSVHILSALLDERCEEDGPEYLTSAMEVFPLLYASADRRSSVSALGTGRIETFQDDKVII